MSRRLPRRSILALLAGPGLLSGLPLPRAAVAQVPAPLPAWRPGVQLYTVRDLLGADLAGTLRRVAEIGYREVELAGPAGSTVRQIADTLKRNRLGAPSMHAGYDELRGDLDAVLADARTLGASFVVCPSIDADLRRTADDWKRVCGTLNGIGRSLRSRGVTLAYHNHDFEFAPFPDGSTPFRLMMAETDPRDVKLELDVYWVAKAGLDPVRYLEVGRDRIVLVHLKDLGAGGATVELGAGRLDVERIVRTALAGGVRHLFVEQDDSADPLRSIDASLRFLERLPADIRPRPGG
jgi:sugar phosphate isomerase/epimerase